MGMLRRRVPYWKPWADTPCCCRAARARRLPICCSGRTWCWYRTGRDNACTKRNPLPPCWRICPGWMRGQPVPGSTRSCTSICRCRCRSAISWRSACLRQGIPKTSPRRAPSPRSMGSDGRRHDCGASRAVWHRDGPRRRRRLLTGASGTPENKVLAGHLLHVSTFARCVTSRPNATAYLGHHFWFSVWSGDMDMSTPMGRGPKMKLVMVGNGMAGVRTLEELLKLAPDLYDITVFGAEPHPNYNRILLPPVLAGEQTVDDIILNPTDWYADNAIHLHLGKKVVKIDRSARYVEAEDGTHAEYDRLLLAAGSNPFMLQVPGADLPGVISFRDIADVDAMIRASSQYRHAVVIGGGLLGLEAANGLMKRGMDVTVVHIGPWLIERQLDEPAARLLQKSLEEKGMKILLPKQTAELVKGESGRD